MAPLPPNSTARVFFDYVTGNAVTSVEHTVGFRVASSLSDDGKQLAVSTFLNSIGAGTLVIGWRIIRARVQAAGSNFSQPIPLIAGLASLVGTFNSSAFGADREAIEWTWQGRSYSTGRRVDISLYGLAQALPVNFRLPVGGSSPAWVGNTVTQLNGAATEILAIDGAEATWYNYVNANYNSYWERRLRSN